MSRRIAIAVATVAALLAAGAPASAERLVATLSQHQVMVNSSFTGTSIVLFGTIEPDTPASRRRTTGYDLVVTVTGPKQTLVARKKERMLLIWANMDQYYIKSSELLRDYTFHISRADIAPGELPLGHLPEEVVIHFKLVEGDTEKDNRKPDGKTQCQREPPAPELVGTLAKLGNPRPDQCGGHHVPLRPRLEQMQRHDQCGDRREQAVGDDGVS